MRTMRAAVAKSFGQPLDIDEVPIGAPQAGQVLVCLQSSGVCHTDLHIVDGDWPAKPVLPLIPGHEGAGYIAEVGHGVHALKAGDRVGIPWLYEACGHCPYCASGWETLCLSQKNTGYTVNGTYAEYVLASAEYVVPLPDALGFPQAAPILCAGVTTYRGLKQTEAKRGDWVVISGIGGTGHIAVQYAKAMGMQVVAIDIDEAKLDLARELGADMVINGASDFPIGKVQKAIGGAQGVLITAVSLKAIEQGIGLLRRGGTCVLVGIPPGKFALSTFDLVVKAVTVRGSIVGTRADLREAFEYAADGRVAAKVEVRPLEDINAVFARMKQGRIQGRIVLGLNASSGHASLGGTL